MQPTLRLWCPVHLNRAAELVCLHPNCMESQRILCGECAAIPGSHKTHNSSLIRVGKISSSSDGSSLQHLRNIFLKTSHFEGEGPSIESVFEFFNGLEKQILQELHRVRNAALEAAQIRENVMVEISNELILSEARISTMLESQIQEQISRNSSRESADMNELIQLTNGGYKGEQNNNNNICFSMNLIDAVDQQEGIDQSYGIYSVERSSRELDQQTPREEYANINNNNYNGTANNAISIEISSELKSLQDNCNEVLIETDIQLHYALSQCHLKLDKFNQQINDFLQATLPQKSKQLSLLNGSNKAAFQQILGSNFSQEINRNEIKLMNACEFFSSIGYHSCIAVDSIDSLSLLKKVSGFLCHNSEQSNQTLQDLHTQQHQQQIISSNLSTSDQELGLFQQKLSTSDEQTNCLSQLPSNIRCESAPIHFLHRSANTSTTNNNHYQLKQTSWQKNYFFSAFLDNKSLSDSLFLSEIPKQLNQMRYISNIHLDFDNNSLSTMSYISLFETLQQFYQLTHLDLRLNHNYAPEASAVEALAQLLHTQKSSLKLLCITMKQLRHSLKRQHTLSLSSSPSSPLDTSCSSQSSTQQQFSIHRRSLAVQEHPREQQQLSQKQEYYFEPNKINNNTNIPNPIHYLQLPTATTQTPQQQPSSQFTQAGDILSTIMNSLSYLSSLEVLYLDFSTNTLESSNVFSSSLNVSTLKVLHIALNHTKLPPQQVLTLFSSLNKRTNPFHSCKVFLKDNGYSFQQQRTISGQFQKVQATQKNFDLFF